MRKLSIIVPIYKVEKYIHQCLESIFRQEVSDEDFEVILVNDGTPDKSMEVIADIIGAHQNIHIIEQQNQGLSMARNNGMAHATGEYILFVDSDDLLVENVLPFLMKKAIESKADLVVADYLELYDNDINTIPLHENETIQVIEKSGEELFLEDIDPHDCHVWHSLYKRAFLQQNGITFVPGIFFEDVPFTHECAIKAKKCLRIHVPMYIYRKGNMLSVTSYFDKRLGMDFGTAIGKTWLLSHTGLSPKVSTKLKQNVFISFSTLFCVVVHNIPTYAERMEILNNIKHAAPDMCFKNGLKQVFVSFMFRRIPHVYMILRSFYGGSIEEFVWKYRSILNHIRNK